MDVVKMDLHRRTAVPASSSLECGRIGPRSPCTALPSRGNGYRLHARVDLGTIPDEG